MMQRTAAIADTAASVSIVTFLGMTLGEWETAVNLLAGVFAITAGAAATYYHTKKGFALRRRKGRATDKVDGN